MNKLHVLKILFAKDSLFAYDMLPHPSRICFTGQAVYFKTPENFVSYRGRARSKN